MRVLVTRPLEDALATCKAVEMAGHRAVSVPLFEVIPVAHGGAIAFDAVLATSAHALRLLNVAIRSQGAALPFFAVGDATAQAATQTGFADVRSAHGDAADLAERVRRELPIGARLLYLAGSPRRDGVIQALGNSFAVQTLEVYRTIAVDSLPDAATIALQTDALDTVMHFSPRATQVFLHLVEKAALTAKSDQLLHVCISEAAWDRRLARWALAARPTMAAMIGALKSARVC